jgi:hypothetical protein
VCACVYVCMYVCMCVYIFKDVKGASVNICTVSDSALCIYAHGSLLNCGLGIAKSTVLT